jgi:hypothetical protein
MSEPTALPPVRVFVNGAGLDVPPQATALDAVRAADAAEGEAVEAGRRGITDSRGLDVPPTAPAYSGAIYRTVRAKAAG